MIYVNNAITHISPENETGVSYTDAIIAYPITRHLNNARIA